MQKEEIYKELNKIFQDVFDNENIFIKETTTADDIEEWNSLEWINLVVAAEKKFEIKFCMEEINSLKTVGDMVEAIAKKI